jgi:hypothetical protein
MSQRGTSTSKADETARPTSPEQYTIGTVNASRYPASEPLSVE